MGKCSVFTVHRYLNSLPMISLKPVSKVVFCLKIYMCKLNHCDLTLQHQRQISVKLPPFRDTLHCWYLLNPGKSGNHTRQNIVPIRIVKMMIEWCKNHEKKRRCCFEIFLL